MNKVIRLFLLAFLMMSDLSYAQLVGDNMYLQGRWLEIGLAPNGAMGATRNAPAGYHPRPGTTLFTVYDPLTCTSANPASALASVYDWGHDGWTVGTPTYMGDYTLPGSPWEGWAIQINSVTNFAYFTNYQSTAAVGCNGYTGSGGAVTTATTGAFTSYSSTGGALIGNWSGSSGSGALSIRKEYRVDTLGSNLVVTAVFKNTTAAALTGVYYMRSLDPDNSETWTGGSFSTNNTIDYQNDFYHRVLVSATGTGTAAATGTPATKLGLGTKDCRAKCLIYTSWPLSTSANLATIWAGTSGSLGTATYNNTLNGDYALGLVYNLGTIAPFDSTVISYAYIYNGTIGIDSAFPAPQMVINGVAYDSIATDTVCTGNTLPVNIIHGNTRDWSWSKWQWSPAIGLASDTGVNNTIDASLLTGVTTYTITGTDSAMGNCASKTFLLTVVPVTSAAPIVRDTTFCQGIVPPPLTATGSGLLWYTTPTGGVGSSTGPIVPTGTLGVFTYYVSQTIAGCTSPRTPINITIAPPPVITLANNGPLCPGSTLIVTLSDTLTVTTGVTYSWTGPGGYTATTHDVTIPNVIYADSGVYTVIVNNNGCATYPTSNTVIVHSTPGSPTIVNPTYCQYLSSSPLTATGSNILWYNTATGGVGSPTAPIPSTAVAGTFTYYVTQTVNGCESLRYPVTVTVNAKPVVPVITNTPGSYCPNQPFNTYTILLGTNILWYTAATGGVGSTTPPVVNTANPGTYTYWASQTVLGCESDRTPVTVTVYDQVSASFNYMIHYGCHGDTVSFYNTSTGAVNFMWDFGDGTSSIAASPTHIYPTQGVYTVKLFSHSANCVDSNIQTIDLRHPNNAGFNFTPGVVCQGLPVTFTDTSVATGPSYMWNFGDGNTSTVKNPLHSYINTGVYNISLVVTDFVPCMDTAYGVVSVDSLGSASMTMSDTVLCLGNYVTLNAVYSHIGLADFVWNFGNGDSIKNVDPVLYAYNTPGTYTISATARYRVCPDAAAAEVITVYPQPTINLGDNTTICDGSTSLILSDAINATNPAATWLWNTGATTPAIGVSVSGLYYVTVSFGGCAASDSVLVTNDCHIAMVTAFTPNGDGVNDYFNPRLYMGEGLKTFNMKIYNRWGELIFEATSIDGRGWDGKYNNVPQPEGVYVYVIDAEFIDGKKVNDRGNITLLR